MNFHAPILNTTPYNSNLKAQPPLQHAIRNTDLLISEPIFVAKPTKAGTVKYYPRPGAWNLDRNSTLRPMCAFQRA